MIKKNPSLPVRIRPVTNDDVPFIFNSWLRCFRESGLFARSVPNTVYFQNHHKILQKLAKRATIYVADNPDDPTQLFGYICAEYIDNIFVIHFMYVKHDFRKLGIGKALLNSFNHDLATASCCSHLTKMAEKFLLKYNIVYHPYTIWLDSEVAAEVVGEEVASEVE